MKAWPLYAIKVSSRQLVELQPSQVGMKSSQVPVLVQLAEAHRLWQAEAQRLFQEDLQFLS